MTAADVRGSAVAANFAAAAGCAFDFDVGFKLARRAFIDRGRFDLVNTFPTICYTTCFGPVLVLAGKSEDDVFSKI